MDARDVPTLVVEVLSTIAPDGDYTSLDPAASLRRQLDLDSLDFMSYVEMLSERTGAPIPEEEYPLVDTINGCVSLFAHTEPVP
jgi:acyl carrier protein